MASAKPNESSVSVGSMTNSVVQQNSPGAVASIRIINAEEKGKVEGILKQVAALVDSLPLPEDDREEMKEDIQTAETQLKGKSPKAGIISTCLRSILAKLSSVAAAPLAARVAEGVQWSIDQITAILGSM